MEASKDLDVLVLENESYKNLTHRRAVFFVDKKFFVIVDEAFGEGEGDVDLHFQLAPGKAVFDNDQYTVRSDFRDGWNVLVQAQNQPGMKLQKEEGQVSFEYTKKEPRPAFRYNVKKQAKETGVRFVTVVAPYKGRQPNLSARIIGQPKIGDQGVELEVRTNGTTKPVSYDLGND